MYNDGSHIARSGASTQQRYLLWQKVFKCLSWGNEDLHTRHVAPSYGSKNLCTWAVSASAIATLVSSKATVGVELSHSPHNYIIFLSNKNPTVVRKERHTCSPACLSAWQRSKSFPDPWYSYEIKFQWTIRASQCFLPSPIRHSLTSKYQTKSSHSVSHVRCHNRIQSSSWIP